MFMSLIYRPVKGSRTSITDYCVNTVFAKARLILPKEMADTSITQICKPTHEVRKRSLFVLGIFYGD